MEWASYVPIGVLLLLMFTFVSGYFYYRNYKFYIDSDQQVFVLEQGLLNKEKTIIQLDKIFQVNIKQDVWHQVLDIYEVEIETAGSASAEVTIQALNEDVAKALKHALLSNKLQAETIEEGLITNDENNLINRVAIGNKNIVVASMLSHYGEGLRVAIGIIVLLFSQFREMFVFFSQQSDSEFIIDTWDRFDVRELLIFLALFLLLPFIVNIYRFVVKYYNATYTVKSKDEMLLTYGLFTLQERIFKISKLQVLHLASNAILRKLGLQFMTLAQANNVQEGVRNSTTVVLPGIKKSNAEDLELLFYGQPIVLGHPLRPVKRKFVFHAVFVTLFLIGILVAIILLDGSSMMIGLFLGLVWTLWMLAIYMSYRNERIFVHPDFIVKQYGSFRKKMMIIQPHKIQNIVVNRKFWRPNFGNLYLYTASGAVSATWYPYDVIKQLAEGYNNINLIDSKPWM